MPELVETLNSITGLVQGALGSSTVVGAVTTTPPVKLPFPDTLIINKGVGATVNIVDKRVDIDVDGVYTITAFGSFSFDLSGEILLGFYKNGVSLGPGISIQGRGAGKPVSAINSISLMLEGGDYIEGFAIAETGSVTLTMAAGFITVERTIFT